MFDEAIRVVPVTRIRRTQASGHDTVTGNLGEIVFAQFFFGDYRRHRLGRNGGCTDFPEIEIKTSAHPFRDTLNLMIRTDYEARRHPRFYVLVVLDVANSKSPPHAGCKAIVCGYCTWEEARRHGHERRIRTPDGGYDCLCVPMRFLHDMSRFRQACEERGKRDPS